MTAKSKNIGRVATAVASADVNLVSVPQRRFFVAFFVLAVVRLHFALSPSYIHPDEHFQGPEVVVGPHSRLPSLDNADAPCVGWLFGWQTSVPWEFTNDNAVHSPIRSILPIWIVYGLPIRIIKAVYGCSRPANCDI
jgi:hypothetical protein